MKRVLLFTLLISFIGYSQNPKQPNHLNFTDNIPQNLVEKMNPMNLEFEDDEMMNFNPSQKFNVKQTQFFQRDMMVQSKNEVTFRLDEYSEVYFSFERITAKHYEKFDQNGKLIVSTITNYFFTETEYLFSTQKSEFTYDENGNRTLNINYNWDTNNQSFILSWKNESTYDEDGNLTLEINYDWNTTTQSFIPSWKNESTYNYNGNLTIFETYFWDTESQSYIPSWKSENTYDQNGNSILYKRYNWDTESQSYILSLKSENTFDDNGNLVNNIVYTWDTDTQSFLESSKEEFSYDESGNQTLNIVYTWDTDTQSFLESSKEEFSYDENGNLTLFKRHIQMLGFDFLVPYQKIEYTYDEIGNLILIVNHYSDLESFIPTYKKEYSFDLKNFKNNETLFSWNSELGVFEPRKKMDIRTSSETDTNLVREGIIYEYDTNFNTWNELEGEEFKSYFYYTKTQYLSTNSVEPNSFSIYPNPTYNSLHINSSESLSNPIFELYDVKGSKILSSPFKLTEPIDVSDLQPSMYIYNVKDGSEVKQSGKVLIE
jgi:hypothetical protein